MATETKRVRVRQGLTVNVPALGIGELGFSSDSKELHVGSGVGNLRVMGDYITPEMLGAAGDGTTDDTAEVQAALDAAETAAVPLAWTGGKTYRISAAITIQCDTLDFGAKIDVYGNPAVAIIVGYDSLTTPTDSLWGFRSAHRVELPNIENKAKPGAGWAGCGTGVMAANIYESDIHLKWVYGFNIGLRAYAAAATGAGAGSCYNNFFIGHLEDNKIALQLDFGSNGFVNENNFYGGRYNIQSAEGSEIAGTRYLQIGLSTAFGCNNNVFYKPSLEGDGPQYHVEFYGGANMIISARWEVVAVNPKVHFASAGGVGSLGNFIFGGYPAAFTITEDALSHSNQIYNREGLALDSAPVGNRSIISLANHIGDSAPVLVVIPAAGKAWGDHSSDYCVQLSAARLNMKRTGDAYPRITVDGDGQKVVLGDGTAAPSAGFQPYLTKVYLNEMAFLNFYEVPDTYISNTSLFFHDSAHRLKLKDQAGSLSFVPKDNGTVPVDMFTHKDDALADDGTVLLPDATSGMVFVSCNAEAGMWLVQADGTVTKISGSTNTAAADTDANLCVYDSGTGATVKNRLGATGEIRIVYYYN